MNQLALTFAPTWPWALVLIGAAVLVFAGRAVYLWGAREEHVRGELRLGYEQESFAHTVARLVRNIDERHSTPDCRRPGTVELRRLMPLFSWPARVIAAPAGSSPCG